MNLKNIKYRKAIRGMVVTYDCPHCESNLKSRLNEAGQNDHCPECGGNFVVPGTEYQKRLRDLKSRQIQAEVQERFERENEKEAIRREREKDRIERAKQKQEETRRHQESDNKRKENQMNEKAKSVEGMEPINYISLGLANLVKIFVTNFTFGLLQGFIYGYWVIFQSSKPKLVQDRIDPDIVNRASLEAVLSFELLSARITKRLLVIEGVAACFVIFLTISFAYSAYAAFAKGAKPKRKTDIHSE